MGLLPSDGSHFDDQLLQGKRIGHSRVNMVLVFMAWCLVGTKELQPLYMSNRYQSFRTTPGVTKGQFLNFFVWVIYEFSGSASCIIGIRFIFGMCHHNNGRISTWYSISHKCLGILKKWENNGTKEVCLVASPKRKVQVYPRSAVWWPHSWWRDDMETVMRNWVFSM